MALCPKTTWRIPDGYFDRDLRTTYGIVYCSNIDLGMMGSDVGKHNIHTHGGYRNITASKNAASVHVGLFSSLTDKIYPVADKQCNYTQAMIFPSISFLYTTNTMASLAFPKRAIYPAYIDFDVFRYRETLNGYKSVCRDINQPLSYLFKGLLVDTSAQLFQKRIYRNDKLYLDTSSYQFKDPETHQVVRSASPDLSIFRPFQEGQSSASAIRNHRRTLDDFKYYGTYYQVSQYNFDNDLYEAHRQEIEDKLKKDTNYNVKNVTRLLKFQYDENDIIYQKLFLYKMLSNQYDWNDDVVLNFIDGKYKVDIVDRQFINIDTLETYTDRLMLNIIYSFEDYQIIDYSKYLKYIISTNDIQKVRDIIKALETNTSLYDTQTDFYYFNFAGIDRTSIYLPNFYKINGWWDKTINHYWQKDAPSSYPDGIKPNDKYSKAELDVMYSYPCYIPSDRQKDELSEYFYKELESNPNRFQRIISEELLDLEVSAIFRTSIDEVDYSYKDGTTLIDVFLGNNINYFTKVPYGSLLNYHTRLNQGDVKWDYPIHVHRDSLTTYNLLRYAKIHKIPGFTDLYGQTIYSRDVPNSCIWAEGYNYSIPSLGYIRPSRNFFECDLAIDGKTLSMNPGGSLGDGNYVGPSISKSASLRVWCENIEYYNKDTRWYRINYSGLSDDKDIALIPSDKRLGFEGVVFNPNIDSVFVDSTPVATYYEDKIDIQRVAYSISPLHCNIENLKIDNSTDNYQVYHYLHFNQNNLNEFVENGRYLLPFNHIVYIKGVTNSFEVPYRETSVTFTKDFLPDDANEEDYNEVYTDINGKRYTIKDDLDDKGEYTAPKTDASVNITSQVLFNFQEKNLAVFNVNTLLNEFQDKYSNGNYLIVEYEDSLDGKIKYEIIEGDSLRWYKSSYKLDRCTPYLWFHNTYHTVQAFRFNTIDPLTSWWSWAVPKLGPRLNLLGQPNASRQMLGGYYNTYDKAQNLYLQKCYNIYTKQWDKIKNPYYTDTARGIDNRKGRVLPRFTNEKLLTYSKPMLTEEVSSKADRNESDYKSYTSSVKTQYGSCITTRFTFTIYFNARIRATKLLARMGWMYLDYIYSQCKPDEVDENGNYYTTMYAPDRTQFAEKRISLRFKRVAYNKEIEGNNATYYCELDKTNTELTFYCRTKQIKYVLQVRSFCPRFSQDYKKYDLNQTIQVGNRQPIRHLEPLIYTHRLVDNTNNPPKTKYKLTNRRNVYEYKVSSIYYDTPMKVEYTAKDDSKQEVEFTPKAEDIFTCFYKPYGAITNTDETYKEFLNENENSNESRSVRKYLRDKVFIRYSNSMIEDTYYKLFNRVIDIKYDELNPFDLDGNIDKLYIQPNSSTLDIENHLFTADSYTKKMNIFHFPKDEYIDGEGTKHSYFDRSVIGWLSNSHLSKNYISKNTINGVFYRDNILAADIVVDYNDPNTGAPCILGLRNDWSDEQNRNHLLANIGAFNEFYTIFANNMIVLLEKNTPDYMKARQDLLKIRYDFDVVGMQQFDVNATLEKYKDLVKDTKPDIPILEADKVSNTYSRNSAIEEILAYIEGVLPNSYVLLISEFENLFVNPSDDFILTKIFSEEQLYRLGQYCYLVTNNIEDVRLDEGVNISYYRIRLIDGNTIKSMFDFKSGSDYVMAYPFLPMPIQLFKKMPIYCKLFIKNMNSFVENMCFIPYPTRDATSMRWTFGWAILDIIVILIISIVITIFTFGAGTPIGIALICLAVAIAILQIVMLCVSSETAKKLGVVVQILQAVSTIVSMGAGAASSVASTANTALTTLQISNIVLSSVNLALSIINTSLDMVYKNKQNKKIEEYNKAVEKYNNKVEEYVNFIESTEFTGMYAINTAQFDMIEKQIDKFDTIDTFFDDNIENTLEGLYTQLDSLYDTSIE